MKRVCLLAVIFLSFISKGYGQYIPLLNDSAVWRQGVQHCNENGMTQECLGWNYYDFKLNGDTIIGQHTYKVVNDINEFGPYAFLREDSGKVFMKRNYESELPYYYGGLLGQTYFIDTTEFLLYDFNLQVGDTFTTRIVKCVTIWPPDTMESTYKFILNSIDSIMINDGSTRKRFHFDAPDDLWDQNHFWGSAPEWIEGIGSTNTFFYIETGYYQGCGMFDAGFSTFRTACYSLNNTILWGVPNCQFLTGVNEVWGDKKPTIFPNPAQDVLTIKGTSTNSIYTLYNILGSIVKSGIINTNQIDISSLTNGTYIVAITDKLSGTIYRNKIVKY